MHRTIGVISKRFVRIAPGEGPKVLLTFLYFFLIITSYYVIKPVSRSLVLGELGSRMVPYADLICAVLMGPIVTLFAKLVDRVPKPRLISSSFFVIIGILLVAWRLLLTSMWWVAAAFYIWVAVFSVLVVTLFWLVANDLYRPREAKRLFGFIGSGGILGGIAGSSIAAFGAHVVGTKHLLLVSAALLAMCWLVVERLWRLLPERVLASEPVASGTARAHPASSHPMAFAKLFWHSRYLLLLVAMVGINKIVATLVYYQLNPFIELGFPTVDAKTHFTSIFLGGMNATAFVVQFFLTSWVLRRWGLAVALLVLPVVDFFGSAGLLLFPTFWLAAVTELGDGSLNYSLQQTSKEVLYLPIDRSIRYKVKPFIDMVVFRFGKGVAAIAGILMLDIYHLHPKYLSCLSLPLVALWILIALRLRREYVGTIRTMLQARAAAPRPKAAAEGPDAGRQRLFAQEPGSEPFRLLAEAPFARGKLALVDQLVQGASVPPPHVKRLIDELSQYDSRLVQAAEVESEALRLRAIISDHHTSMAKRRQALRSLARIPEQATVDYLFSLMVVETETVLRHEAVRGLVKLRLRHARVEFPVPQIRRQIASEVAGYQRIMDVINVYRRHCRGPVAANDPIIALLRILMEESVEQVFRLLMLIYRPEDIHLAYEQMTVTDAYVRADAIELLDNLIDPAMRSAIFPILDEDRFLSALEDAVGATQEPTTAYRILQQAIWDHHCWLSVTTLCAVGRLRLTPLRQELEKASRHPTHVISSAAKVALHLASQS